MTRLSVTSLLYFTPFSSVSIIIFEKLIAGWEGTVVKVT